ncbi:MAG TPA: hypothetical protein VNS09_22385 [Solirubrobacter sp.]|nr:hypothetical protein [Solirubrobacter sp.]
MDPVLDRVRAANPVTEAEFAGAADFDALVLPRRPRRRRRWLAVPALGTVVAALVLVPSSAPGASEILRRASVAVGDGILYAQSTAELRAADGEVDHYGTRRVWVRGDDAMRWVDDQGNEDVYAKGAGTAHRDGRTGEVEREPDASMVAGDIFRSVALLQSARAGDAVTLEGETTVDGRPAYVLRWTEQRGGPAIEQKLWIDRETYAPLRYTDHSRGRDVSGKPFDQTYVETVQEFRTLPDTPENRRLLELGG